MLHVFRPIPVESLKLLAFDLDGTLIDSAQDLCNSVNAMLGHFGQKPLQDPVIASFVGNGTLMLVRRALAREDGLTIREERYSIDQWRAEAASGALLETFACGTAAVVTPVGTVCEGDTSFTIGSGGPGQVTSRLKERLVAIQRGEMADTHEWVVPVA